MRYVENPPNPWLTHSVEWIGEPPEVKLEVFEETETRKIITHNNSPDVGFDYTVNCIGDAFTVVPTVLVDRHTNTLVMEPVQISTGRLSLK